MRSSPICRSLLAGDSSHGTAAGVPLRLPAGSYLSLRGLLVVLALIAQLSALNFSAHAAELTDLGEGLAYLRVHAVDDSAKGLTAALSERDALVLDLRYATASTESPGLLRSALHPRPGKHPVVILVSPATPAALAETLKAAPTKLIFLGVKDSLPTPQVVIDQPAATDRLAYEALDSGQPLAELISGQIGKPRFDEAVLMKDFNGAEPPPAPAVPKAADTPAPKLTDRVLQRAVHLHRALLAIKQR